MSYTCVIHKKIICSYIVIFIKISEKDIKLLNTFNSLILDINNNVKKQ